MEKTTNLTHHRGNSRLWLEGKYLAKHGFCRHQPYKASFEANQIVLSVDLEGDRKVSGRMRKGATEWTPIIDINSPQVSKSLGSMSANVKLTDGKITIWGA